MNYSCEQLYVPIWSYDYSLSNYFIFFLRQANDDSSSSESVYQTLRQIMHFQIVINWNCRCDTKLSRPTKCFKMGYREYCLVFTDGMLRYLPSQVPDHAFSNINMNETADVTRNRADEVPMSVFDDWNISISRYHELCSSCYKLHENICDSPY